MTLFWSIWDSLDARPHPRPDENDSAGNRRRRQL